jgi:hypothetical protein
MESRAGRPFSDAENKGAGERADGKIIVDSWRL